MRIVVLGAGYAGLTLARRLEDALGPDHELIVVNDSPSHLVQHEIHRAIRRPAIAEGIVVPLTEVLDRATVRVAQVEGVDPDAKTVSLAAPPSAERAARAYDGKRANMGDDDGDGDSERAESEGTAIEIEGESERADSADDAGNGREECGGAEEGDETESVLAYDVCAVCLGAETDFQDVPGVAEHATPLKRLRDAERIREDFLSVLPEGGRVVICGAGLSGIQVAGELAALAREEGASEDCKILLTEALEEVAPAFSTEFSRAVCEELEDRSVEIRTNAPVERATEDGIVVDDEELATDQLLWTGGIRGPRALENERPVVRSTLELGEGTFLVGDAARVVDTNGAAVPASAQSAVREAGAVAKSIATIADHGDQGGFRPRLEPFTFDSPGWLVSVGDGAVAQVGPTVLRGKAAKALKTSVGAGYLTSVGAIGNAVDLAREELALSPD
ncbi:NADH dehydrogenase FAD-containing subunit [Halobacteriales archaeon QS_3_64_16]|nr:MAG: NADH dehydrogenase FAD-containing subunit [Halobacteriales archaeon QS_3_64_16]